MPAVVVGEVVVGNPVARRAAPASAQNRRSVAFIPCAGSAPAGNGVATACRFFAMPPPARSRGAASSAQFWDQKRASYMRSHRSVLIPDACPEVVQAEV